MSPRRTPNRTEHRIKLRILRRWGPARTAGLLSLVAWLLPVLASFPRWGANNPSQQPHWGSLLKEPESGMDGPPATSWWPCSRSVAVLVTQIESEQVSAFWFTRLGPF
jgi:hypothetical protein